MPVILLLLAGAVLAAVFAAAWIADRLLRPRPRGKAYEIDADRGETAGHPLNTEPGYGGLEAFTWTEEEPEDRR